jgi:antitoxin ParD1/3/4
MWSLTPELERFVQDKVQTGRYNSASEVVREALRVLHEREQLRELQIQEFRKRIAEGAVSLDRGEGVDSETFMAELEASLQGSHKIRKSR